jgi:hypothetical protein
MPNFSSGNIWFYTGNAVPLKLDNNASNVSIGSGWKLASTSVFLFRATTAGTPKVFDLGGSYRFGLSAAVTGSGGRIFNFYNGTPPSNLDNTDYSTTLWHIDDNA